jgi:DNA modification methylase
MTKHTLHLGDCLDVLRTLPDNSVDSVVTDPPYGLSFMGKRWDYDVPAVEVWAECLRVLKPGGHLLAFAGTRTQHRMAVRIEDAGFEIRDMIAWVYSTGFPKSLNITKATADIACRCQSSALPYTHARATKPEHHLPHLRGIDVPPTEDASGGQGALLQPGVPEQGLPPARREKLPASEVWGGQSGVEGWRDDSQPQGELRVREVHPSSDRHEADGAGRRVHHGAPPCDGSMVQAPAVEDGSGPSHRPQPDEQRQVKSGVVAGQRQPQKSGAWDLCPGCSKPMVPDGFGTSLKPSLEPITVARKPLSGTVAETVTTWGTGAINVDGCRVPGEKPDTTRGASIKAFSSPALLQQGRIVDDGLGRFPANLIHDGSDEVVGLFPQAPSAGKYKHPEKQKNVGERGADWSRHLFRAEANKRRDNKYAGDSGSAARFFYCAKASKEDRDEGCDALPFRESAEMVDRDEDSAGIKSPRAGAGRKNGARNFHPTVKPTDLMRYLCRLVTPPGGTVLDPFMGSGSTGKGALEEGFRFIGIERDPEYFKIAEVRIPPRQPRLF